MTTCPRCGQPLQAPVPACPRCGQRFAPPAQQYQANGYDGTAAAWGYQAPPQPAQAPQQYQQPAPGHGPGQPAARPGFSVNELVSEEALPDWLRQASADSAQPTQRQPIPGTPGAPGYPPQQAIRRISAMPHIRLPISRRAPGYGGNGGDGGYAPAPAQEPPVQRPDANAFPSIENAGSYQGPLAGGGMPASSLLDPNALPTWLGGQQGQVAPDGMRGGEGMRAQSLVDEAALPGWMRNEPASPAQAPVAAPPPVAAPGWGGYPAAPVGNAIPPAGYAGMPMSTDEHNADTSSSSAATACSDERPVGVLRQPACRPRRAPRMDAESGTGGRAPPRRYAAVCRAARSRDGRPPI